MGVFAMFRRKKKDAAAVSSDETETGAVVPAADGDTERGSGTEAGTDASEAATASGVDTAKATAAEADGVDADEVQTGAVASEVVEVVDVVEIPKQQSAEAAADNEAGEGARK
ncbi:hypothetical protein [Streptomyces sp. NBC_00233]|uniref:hypothetical protein n=1 Tax=Streptomyces sp. NBC_00233 TaxID=2975686 RepID=UPI002251F028|nr:hypothetical protein [Streptomyces sp. NBC_00233]MCX5229147.1 hypothetical protein [Streptomyces sp. NBC_00233]